MFPISGNPLPSIHHQNTTTTKKRNKLITELKSYISIHNSKCLTYTLIIHLLLLLFFLIHSYSSNYVISTANYTCKFGKIYVYDLPPMLNIQLLENCQDLDPYGSRCNGVSNGGFGPKATVLDDIGPRNLAGMWYWTDMYFGEVIYHERIKSYKCRTLDQDDATAFYIPFYAGLAVGKYLNGTWKDRDFHALEMVNWIKNQQGWKSSNGSDHFIMLGRLTWTFRRMTDEDGDWGTKLLYMPLMKNVFHLTVERPTWDPLEMSVPYPTSFHPRTVDDIREWQRFVRSRERSSLFSFVGATRKKIKNDFRGFLMDYCLKSNLSRVVDCSVVHCTNGAPEILEAFLDSDFCLQPKGDGLTRRSAFDCMLAGSIPVYFWRGSIENQYEWHLPADAASYSVFIDHESIQNGTSTVREVLEKYSRNKVKKMKETIVDMIPRMLYSEPGSDLGEVSDAFDIAMEGVLRRFKQQKMVGHGER